MVQQGDSMWAISQRLGITLQALKDANPQVKPTEFQINVGDVLKIPGKGPGPKPPGGTHSGTYIVQSGDSMWAISERLGINLQALKDANPQVRSPDFRINVGDVLKISGGKPGGTRYYTVVSGDSLYIIANAHGVSLEALKAANPQVQPPQFLINVGQVITIP
jgi:LysM repeat protein